MRNRESEEMYLETILLLQQKQGNVRSVDIVEELGYAKSSVSRGVNLLAGKNYIDIDHKTGNITFTKEGQQKAESIYERHRILKQVFVNMGVAENVAEENACRIEHVISNELFDSIKNHLNKTK